MATFALEYWLSALEWQQKIDGPHRAKNKFCKEIFFGVPHLATYFLSFPLLNEPELWAGIDPGMVFYTILILEKIQTHNLPIVTHTPRPDFCPLKTRLWRHYKVLFSPAVNFINILRVLFSYESDFFCKFLLPQPKCNQRKAVRSTFVQKKRERKMLIKLSPVGKNTAYGHCLLGEKFSGLWQMLTIFNNNDKQNFFTI